MASTLELYDGTDSLNLLGAVFNARRITGLGDTVQTRGATDPRLRQTIAIDLNITGTSTSDLVAQIRALDSMLVQATHRQELGHGTIVVLKTQLGSTDADDIEYRVIRGGLVQPDSLLQAVLLSQWKVIEATIRLEVEPLGRLPSLTLFAPIIENEVDGNEHNHIDVSNAFGPHPTFDGVDDKVTVSDAAAIQNAFYAGGGVECRFKADSDGENDEGRLIDKTRWTLYVLDESGGAAKLGFYYDFDGTDGIWETTTRVVTLGTEYHVALVFDADSASNNPTFRVTPKGGTTQTLTVGGGVTETSTPTGSKLSDVGFDLLVGETAAGTRAFAGWIDEVRQWSDTRTAQEIADNFQAELVGNEAGLVLYLPFSDGMGTRAKDGTSNGNNGTISGAIWAIDEVEGSATGRLNLKVHDTNNGGGNAWTGSENMWLYKRTGSRRTDTLLFQQPDSTVEGDDPWVDDEGTFSSPAGLTTNASQGTSKALRWTANQINPNLEVAARFAVGYFQYDIATPPKGIFRVLARISNEYTLNNSVPAAGNFAFALGYVYGGKTYVPVAADDVPMTIASEDTWETLDIGQIIIPPVATPDGYTEPTLNLRIYCIWPIEVGGISGDNNTDYVEWAIDYIQLGPIDEGAVAVGSIGTNDRILVDGQSDKPGVYKLNASDVVQDFADSVGPPFTVGPEPTRVIVVRNDPGDPTTTQFTVTPVYIPRVEGV